MAEFSYPKDVAHAIEGAKTLLLVAPKKTWLAGWAETFLPRAIAKRVAPLVTKDTKPGDLGKTVETIDDVPPQRIVAAVLPDQGSRHNSPTRLEPILGCAKKAELGPGTTVVLGLDDPRHVLGALVGLARACPLFSMKSEKSKDKAPVRIVATDATGSLIPIATPLREAVAMVRWAAERVDTPTRDLTTADFVVEAKKLVRGLKHVRASVIVGEELLKKGLMGIHAVGQAAVVPPRLLVLEYTPPRAQHSVGLIGKGIVYDTGGLSLKPTASMSSMKGDMGGAAAVCAAFRVLAARRAPVRVIALAALAENAIGPNSFRNDDILTMHSGHTVEINNTDAEGRLLLGDALSYCGRVFKPDLLIDIATLTGAQLVATGLRHAAAISNRQGLEDLAVACGQDTGDLVFPLPFAPEFYKSEFKSVVADMKNSVGNRSNAQSSCAAQFVYNHIDDLDLPWLHLDIAGPSFRDERGTGFGVTLLTSLVEELRQGALEA